MDQIFEDPIEIQSRFKILDHILNPSLLKFKDLWVIMRSDNKIK